MRLDGRCCGCVPTVCASPERQSLSVVYPGKLVPMTHTLLVLHRPMYVMMNTINRLRWVYEYECDCIIKLPDKHWPPEVHAAPVDFPTHMFDVHIPLIQSLVAEHIWSFIHVAPHDPPQLTSVSSMSWMKSSQWVATQKPSPVLHHPIIISRWEATPLRASYVRYLTRSERWHNSLDHLQSYIHCPNINLTTTNKQPSLKLTAAILDGIDDI